MTDIDFTKFLRCAAIILLSTVYAFLSVFAYLAYADEQTHDLATMNFFTTHSDELYRKLEKNKLVLQQRAEFMVFEDEQVKLQNQLLNILTLQVNAQPFNVQLWRDLVFAQNESNSTTKDRIWSFFVWEKMHKWNSDEQVNLLGRCAFFVESENSQALASSCTAIFKQLLEKKKATKIARLLKVSMSELSQLAAHYEVELESKTQ